MKKNYRLGKFGLTALVFLLLGYFVKIAIYPCKISPVVQFPVYTWKLCDMAILGKGNWVGIHEMYFGLNTTGKVIALVLNWVVAYLIVLLLIYLYRRYKK